MGTITGYHAHIYYDEPTIDTAREVCERAAEKFDVAMGRMHERPVGPHPVWSCQLAFDKNKFGRVIPWLCKNRQGLTVFIHPITGDDLKDHTDHAIWMGSMMELNLEIFR